MLPMQPGFVHLRLHSEYSIVDGIVRLEGAVAKAVADGMPEAKHIRIVCAGVALTSLGGHFPLDQPLDPEDWP